MTNHDDCESIVSVRDLKKTYGSWSIRGSRRIEALRGISLEAQPGEVFGLLGPNGAGKTTLIKTLLGVIKPSSGSASMFGIEVGSAKARMRVGYLPESLRVDKHHTARSALSYYGRLSRMDAASIRHRSDELLELVGLAGRDKESVRRFSKGMYQRLGLAQALMHDPDLLLLDEPTDGLDPVGRNEVRRVIDRLRDLGKTIFLNSHILQEVELVCTRVAILAKGRLLANATPAELREQSSHHQQLELQVLPPDAMREDSVQCEKTIQHCLDLGSASRPINHKSQRLLANPMAYQINTLATAIDSVSAADSDQAGQDITNAPAMPESTSAINQATVDQIVDRLRGEGFSILRLELKGPTLEDTFIKLVGPTEEAN